MVRLKATHFSWLGPELVRLLLGLLILVYFTFPVVLFDTPGISSLKHTRCFCRVLAVVLLVIYKVYRDKAR